jgi:hypothetical protein
MSQCSLKCKIRFVLVLLAGKSSPVVKRIVNPYFGIPVWGYRVYLLENFRCSFPTGEAKFSPADER